MSTYNLINNRKRKSMIYNFLKHRLLNATEIETLGIKGLDDIPKNQQQKTIRCYIK